MSILRCWGKQMQKSYNNGNGDLGPSASFVVPVKATAANSETIKLDFTQDAWTAWNLTGDGNSGISSGDTYTAAVNIGGATEIVNGVTFTGTNGTSGTNWSITQGLTSGPGPTQDSSVTGKIGDILDDAFRYGGDPQKLKLTGLTDGQKYVFSIYSQAWGSVREVMFSCPILRGLSNQPRSLFWIESRRSNYSMHLCCQWYGS